MMMMDMHKLKQLDDEQLVNLYREGCNQAFDALLMRYDAHIHTYLRYSVADEDLVEDLFQEVFIKVMLTIRQGRYSSEGKFKQWISRIAYNLVMDHFRAQKGQLSKLQPIGEGQEEHAVVRHLRTEEPNVEELMVQMDLIGELQHSLQALPPEQRQVVQMRFWEGMSFKEIAESTGVSINTALGRMRYALQNLRKHLPA